MGATDTGTQSSSAKPNRRFAKRVAAKATLPAGAKQVSENAATVGVSTQQGP